MRIYKYIDYLKELLKSQNTSFKVNIGKLSPELNSIAIILMPSTNQYFYQGQRDINVQVQILVKSFDQEIALKISEQIADLFISEGLEVYSEPSFAYQDEQAYVYTTAYRKII